MIARVARRSEKCVTASAGTAKDPIESVAETVFEFGMRVEDLSLPSAEAAPGFTVAEEQIADVTLRVDALVGWTAADSDGHRDLDYVVRRHRAGIP